MPAARPRPLPRARTPQSGHIRDRCCGRLRLATTLPVSRNFVILTPLRPPYHRCRFGFSVQYSILCFGGWTRVGEATEVWQQCGPVTR
eukprot:scaffold30358_cov90-Isochrysis_galbana.AAC.1